MTHRAALIWMTIVVATGTALRLWPINAHSFWLDEAFSWTMATKYSFAEIVQRTLNDFNPPLYYMILKCWIAVFGDSEIAQRMLSVTSDVLTIWMLFAFCRDVFAVTNEEDRKRASRSVGVLAAALYAVNGIHIHWAMETRMYSMATLLTVISSWSLLRAFPAVSSASSKALAPGRLFDSMSGKTPAAGMFQSRWWICYVISATALLYTHNYGVFTVFGQLCFVVGLFISSRCIRHRCGKESPKVDISLRVMKSDSSDAGHYRALSFSPPIVAMIVIGIAFLPWLSALRSQTQQAQDDYWIPAITWSTIPKTWLDLLVHENQSVDQRDSGLAIIVFVISLLVLGCFAWKSRSRGTMLVLFMIASPIVCSAAVSIVSLPIITSRHYLTACAFFFCAVAYDVIATLPRQISKVVAAMFIVNMLFLHFSYRDELRISNDSGIRAAIRHVADKFQEGDAIVVADQAILLSTRYYTNRYLAASDAPYLSTPKLFRSTPLKTWLGSALIDDSDRLSAHELADTFAARLWIIGDATKSFLGWDELPPKEWTEQSSVSFQGSYYFERSIRVWQFVPKELGERATSVP